MKKKPGVASTGRKLPVRSDSPDLTAVSQTVQEIVERFELIESQPLPLGQSGQLLLDLLERFNMFRDRIREKARYVLVEQPGAIPHWRAEMQSRRSVSRNTLAVYDAVESVIPELPEREFLKYCTTSISGLIRLLKLEGHTSDEINARLEEILGEDLLGHELVVALRRDKEGK
jgi:hypothetical protein